MNDDYEDRHFALVLAAIAAGLGAEEAIHKATQTMKLLGYIK